MNIDDTSDDMSSELEFLSPSAKTFLETRMMCVCTMVGVVQ